MFVKTVFSKVTVDKQINNDTATKGYGQAEDVYKRGGLYFCSDYARQFLCNFSA
jgi:hypothetical protein